MITETHVEQIGGLSVEIVRKPIKNLHLGVYPPDGHVRVAAPPAMSDTALRVAVIDRMPWIRRHQTRFRDQARETPREYVSGETHWYLGRRYRLSVIESDGRAGVQLAGRRMELRCESASSKLRRAAILDQWYRVRLRVLLAPLIRVWAERLSVDVTDWRLRRMKTKWGACNAVTGRLLFNLELAKKPQHCIEYVVVHELTHLVVRRHGRPFVNVLDQLMPRWRSLRHELGQLPLGGAPGLTQPP